MKCRAILIAVAFLVLAPTAPLTAMPRSVEDRLQLFATCAGRFSALAEAGRLFDGTASEHAIAISQVFAMLVDATLPYGRPMGIEGQDVLGWRVSAKMAQITLLQTARLHSEADRRDRARRLARQHLRTCEIVILGT